MPPRSLRNKAPVKYLVEHDEDGNELITSEDDTAVNKGDPDFDDKVEEDSDKENTKVTKKSTSKKRGTLDDSDDEPPAHKKEVSLIDSGEEDAPFVALDTSSIDSSLARDLEEMRERNKVERLAREEEEARLEREGPASPPKKKRKPSKKSNHVDGFTVEQWRRQLGNGAKKTISFQKWGIHAQTHFTNPFTSEAFRALIVPHADEYYPKDFTANTPVIMASTFSNSKAGDIMGSSKLSGGSRYGSWSATKVDYIYVAAKKELRVWFTMGNESRW